tara:strand:- start:1135 stop:1941 length:807 start_codon:yes stop_codon:yes gene_type:complete
MGRFATGKRSNAISDRSGFKVPYTQLKTTWDNLRVEPEEWEVKHPQLTPSKNVTDPVALINPRPDNDPDPVTIFLTYNWFNTNTTSMQANNYNRPLDIFAVGNVGHVSFETSSDVTGVAGTGAIGTEGFESSIDEAGVAGTGAVGTSVQTMEVSGVSGIAGTGAVGVEALSLSITESGVAGTGAIGTEVPEASITETGVAGTGAVGTETFELSIDEAGVAGTGAIGTEVPEASITESGVAGTGAVGTESITVNQEWGSGAWNVGAWGQ